MASEIKSPEQPSSAETARFFLIDCDLQIGTGHNFQTSLRVARSVRKSGYAPIVLANRHFPVEAFDEAGVDVIPTFKAMAFDFPGVSDGRRRIEIAFDDEHELSDWEIHLQQLLAADAEHGFTDQDIFYAHTVSMPVALAWLYFLILRPADKRPRIYGQIYIKPEWVQGERLGQYTFTDVLRRFDEEGFLNRNIFFHVETRGLQRVYEEAGFAFPIFMGPIPESCFHPQPSETTLVTTSYLGEARKEKGFVILPDVIEEVRDRIGRRDFAKLRFLVQVTASPLNDTPEIRSARRRLEALSAAHPNIELLGKLSGDAYQKAMDETDICFLGYEPEAYEVRGSGVAVEMLAAGKLLLCSPGIDVVDTFADYKPAIADTYSGEGFGRRLVQVLRDAEFDVHWLRREGEGLREFHEDGFFDRLIEAHEGGQTPQPLRVLRAPVIYFSLGGDSGGSEFVQQAHLSALNALGYRVFMIDLAWPYQSAESYRVWKDQRVSRFLQADDKPMALPLFGTVASGRDVQATFLNEDYMAKREGLSHRAQRGFLERFFELNSLTAQLVEQISAGLVFTNYAYSVPLVRKLMSGQTYKLIVELHDWLAEQNRIRRRIRDGESFDTEANDALDTIEAADERKCAAMADQAIAISGPLRDLYDNADGVNVDLLRPMAPLPARDAGTDFTDPDRANEFLRQNLTDADYLNCALLLEAEGAVSLDLLFVGTDHAANILSLEAFLRYVFFPHIAKTGAKLFLAGTIGRALRKMKLAELETQSTSIVPLGIVADLVPLYHMAKVTVLTVSEGTGFPTKVIETLSQGQAFTINSRALYDLADEAKSRFSVTETADETAQDILNLLGDETTRKDRGSAGAGFAQAFFGRERYVSQMAVHCGLEGDSIALDEQHVEPLHSECTNIEFVVDEDRFFQIEPDTEYVVNDVDIPRDYMVGDWSYAEANQTWMYGKRAGLLLRCGEDPLRRLHVSVSTPPEVRDIGQTLTVLIDGKSIGEYRFRKNSDRFDIEIPEDLVSEGERFVLEFVARRVGAFTGDRKELSISVQTIGFAAAPPVEETLSPGGFEYFPCGDNEWVEICSTSDFPQSVLRGQWSHLEDSGVWLAGTDGAIRLQWTGEEPAQTLLLMVATDISQFDDEKLDVEYVINGQMITDTLTASRSVVLLDISDIAQDDDGRFLIEVRPMNTFKLEGEPRNLSLMLSAIRLTSKTQDAFIDKILPTSLRALRAAVAEAREELEEEFEIQDDASVSGPVPEIDFEAEVSFGDNSPLELGLHGDWSFAEGDHRWIAGEDAAVTLRSKSGEAVGRIVLHFAVFPELVSQKARITIQVNGRDVAAFDAEKEFDSVELDLSPLEPAEFYILQLSADQAGEAPDGRSLSLSMVSMKIFPA